MAGPGEYCGLENKQKCTDPKKERITGELMELNDKELNYIIFGDEMDSNDTNNDLDEDFVL